MTMKKTIFVLGAGNGCGNRVAEKFGKNDFRVVLMARNAEHLAAYEAEFKEKGIEVYTKVADASKPYSVTKAFDELKAQSQKNGAILVTGGGLSLYPMYEYLPLSMDKAALRAMCLALHEELKKQNVYLGTVTVTDVIAPGGKCGPALLAEDFWKLYTERKDCEVVH